MLKRKLRDLVDPNLTTFRAIGADVNLIPTFK